MNLSYRACEANDLVSNIDCFRHWYGNDDSLLKALPDIWGGWLASGLMIGMTVEDSDRPAGSRIVAIGGSAFVTDEFIELLRSDPKPILAERIVREVHAGRSPLILPSALGRKNAVGGLNMANIHYGFPSPDRSPADVPFIEEKLAQSFFVMQSGYYVKEFIQDVKGKANCDFNLAVGLKLRSDYSEYYMHQFGSIPDSADRYWLIGLTREEALAVPGTRASMMFVRAAPRLGLSTHEQRLLQLALEGRDDEEAAAKLSISRSAVKKRWVAIFDAIEAANPMLLPSPTPSNGLSQNRGAEKRRHIMRYVRLHPEELRPFSPE